MRIEAELGHLPAVRELIDFIKTTKRGICGAARFDPTVEEAAA
jgi:UDP-N-acetylglucosamine acyltransferase